jgi:hypothetical protein
MLLKLGCVPILSSKERFWTFFWNRTLDPFDALAKTAEKKNGVANWVLHVPMVRQFVSVFNNAVSPMIDAVRRIAC